jgi:hypothetical protein
MLLGRSIFLLLGPAHAPQFFPVPDPPSSRLPCLCFAQQHSVAAAHLPPPRTLPADQTPPTSSLLLLSPCVRWAPICPQFFLLLTKPPEHSRSPFPLLRSSFQNEMRRCYPLHPWLPSVHPRPLARRRDWKI